MATNREQLENSRGWKRGWVYCYMRGKKAVFLNRWGETIKTFNTYAEAEEYANKNEHLIDKPLSERTRDLVIDQALADLCKMK